MLCAVLVLHRWRSCILIRVKNQTVVGGATMYSIYLAGFHSVFDHVTLMQDSFDRPGDKRRMAAELLFLLIAFYYFVAEVS